MWAWLSSRILRNRNGILVVLGLITLFMGWGMSRVRMSYRYGGLLPKDDSAYVQYERLPDGFRLASRYRAQTVRGGAHFGLLGDLLHDGTRTTADITDELIQAGMPVLDAVAWLDKVYQTGVIAEP